MRKIDLLVVHCSASDNPKHDNTKTIKEWHIERGFKDIGYHYVIVKNGDVFVGRLEREIGAHVRGHNSNSIGICLTGLNEFSGQQKKSLEKLLHKLCMQYNLKKTDILGHCDLDKGKTCPNFDLNGFLSSLSWH